MAEPSKMSAYIPVAIASAIHLVFIGISYGTLSSEVKTLNVNLKDVVTQLKATNEHTEELRRNDIRFLTRQEYLDEKIKNLENKHK